MQRFCCDIFSICTRIHYLLQPNWYDNATIMLACNIFFFLLRYFTHFIFTLLHFEGNSTFIKHFFNFPLFFQQTLSFTALHVSKECFDSKKNVPYNLKQLRFF